MNAKLRPSLFLAVLTIIVALTAVPWTAAQAEAEPTGFKSVHLWLYPEYDDPRLLVMLEGDVEGVDIPATVRFLVPTTAEMYSAGSMDALGQYSGGPPQRKSASLPGWDEISYEVTTETFRVEYYAPVIRGQPDKTISYESRFLYPISDLIVIIQEPHNSSNFSVLPKANSTYNDGEFDNHLYNYSDLDVDVPLHFDIAYTKSDPNPSLVINDGGSTNTPLIVGTVVGLGILLAMGAYWTLRLRPRQKPTLSHAGAPNRRAKSKKRLPNRFCTQCGHSLEDSHRFCPNCGADAK